MSLAQDARTFKALADEHRLRILEFIAAGDPSCCATGDGFCGCDIEDLLGLAQPTVSHHMRVLVDAGLVRGEKRGKWVYYTLDPAGLSRARAILGRLENPAPQLMQLEVVS